MRVTNSDYRDVTVCSVVWYILDVSEEAANDIINDDIPLCLINYQLRDSTVRYNFFTINTF
jgi:hypothetical protein